MDRKQVNYLGAKIQKLRKEKGMSQDELARKANVPYTTLTKIEIGVIKKPSVFVIAKMAVALDITIDDLVYGSLFTS